MTLKCPYNERFLKEPMKETIEFSPMLNTFCINLETLQEINGIHYLDEYLTKEQETEIINVIDSNSFEDVLKRNQQFYGLKYFHTNSDNSLLQPTGEKDNSLPIDPFNSLLKQLVDDGHFGSTPYPDQVLVNEYKSNIGIRSHFEDTAAFGPVIVTISLNDPIWITLKKPRHAINACPVIEEYCRILLKPRSLFIMEKDARYLYRHGISKSKSIPIDNSGGVLQRDDTYRRLSLTIRKLLDTRKKVEKEGWNDERYEILDSCNC